MPVSSWTVSAPAADVRRYDPHLLGLEIQRTRRRPASAHYYLRWIVERKIFALPHGRRGVRFHWLMMFDRGFVGNIDLVLSRRKRRAEITFFNVRNAGRLRCKR